MRKIIVTLIASLGLLVGIGVTPAAAVLTNTMNVCGYIYDGAIDMNRPNGNIKFNWWSITSRYSSGLPMEYRVRWFAPAGNAIYDTGYVASYNGNPGGNPGTTAYFGPPGSYAGYISLNIGKAGDGCPTGAMNFPVYM